MSFISLDAKAEHVRLPRSDAFLAALLAPLAVREDFLSLVAFQQEISAIRGKVSEPALGQIRLQWWREALLAILGGGPAPCHEVLLPLDGLIRRHRPVGEGLLALIDAHEWYFSDQPWQNLEEMENEARNLVFPLLKLQMQIAGEESEAALLAASHMATANALTDLIFSARVAPFPPVVVAGLAKRHLKAGRQIPLSRKQRRLLALGPLTALRLRQLYRCSFDPGDPRLKMPHPARGLALAWHTVFG